MNFLQSYSAQLMNREDLSVDQALSAAKLLASEEISPEDKLIFLRALGEKGESTVEVSAFAEAFLSMANKPVFGSLTAKAIDVVGTGGDASGSFNISTITSFILAASGVPVVKHGNRSVTSKCGSADMLEGVGYKITSDPDILKAYLESLNFVFLFAPDFHPAFKSIGPVRKLLAAEGKKSIFNILGPLINPASPAYQLLGVFSPQWVECMAQSLSSLGCKRGLVVNCQLSEHTFLDELSCAGRNVAFGVGAIAREPISIDVQKNGLEQCDFVDLKGGNVQENLNILDKVLRLEAPKGLMDSLLLNAGAGLWVAERANSLTEGILMARETLESGKLVSWIQSLKKFTYGL